MASGTATVTASAGLNVRKGPGTENAKLGALTKGTKVQYYSETNGWLQIKYAGQTGYISKQYTSVTQSSTGGSSSSSSSSASGKVQVTASALNVRAGAGTGYKILGTLSNGKVVSYSSESNGWLRISYNGQTGWISKKYTKAASGSSNSGSSGSGSSTTKTETRYVTASSLNVRSGAGTSYSVVGSLSRGASVSVYSTSGNWSQIAYNSGKAWVCNDYLSKTKPSTTTSGGGSAVVPSGTNPADYATNYLFSKTGLYTHDFLKNNPRLKNFTDLSIYGATYNYGYNCNCANFVTACSVNTGWMSKNYISVQDMYYKLKAGTDGYRVINGSQAKKGDIWCNTSLGHTELVYSRSGTSITLIGSNNAGTSKQRVTYDSSSASGPKGYFLSKQ